MTMLLECLGRKTLDRQAPMKLLGLEASRDHYVVERIKNRFVQPAIGGYMDLLVNIRINGYVCEIQIHWRPIYDAMGEDGRRLAKWFQHFPADGDGYSDGDDEASNRSPASKASNGNGQPHGGQYVGDMV